MTGGQIAYLAAGPDDGPLVVLVHGWPAAASTWSPQLRELGSAGYRVIAPDMRGYGESSVPTAPTAYALRHLVEDLRTLIAHLGRQSAVWVGHDWGAAVVWAVAAHHPELCDGVAGLVVPYRTLDRGLEALVAYVDREVYPEREFPFGQFDYMAYFEESFAQVTAFFDTAPDRVVRALYRRGDPSMVSGRSPRATVRRDGGWFGGATAVPDVDRDPHVLDDVVYDDVVAGLRTNGFSGPNGYYLNHVDNHRYSEDSVDGGVLRMPTLFVEARYEPTADTVRTRLAEPMRDYCPDLTEVSLAAGHWVGLERPAEVNAALVHWLHAAVRPASPHTRERGTTWSQ
ncbi:alpha/beta fold hydrolase [Mycolicibacterium sp. P1-18]|uniref:alpha/beta fold hydrolase n=1 Tax=Mycolicibacterium sp. P1-18 TaxID=2024615 RepID=UPI0018D5F071|nr:alpha/beta hydrolase [Mycolicibacterium sp. P1-18]